jgi:hypothetical protein
MFSFSSNKHAFLLIFHWKKKTEKGKKTLKRKEKTTFCQHTLP